MIVFVYTHMSINLRKAFTSNYVTKVSKKKKKQSVINRRSPKFNMATGIHLDELQVPFLSYLYCVYFVMSKHYILTDIKQ